jgi:DNA-binding transcriptional MerR regulator
MAMNRHVDVKLVATKDAADILGISREMVRCLARSGQLPVALVLPSGQRLFRADDVAALALARAVRAEEIDVA